MKIKYNFTHNFKQSNSFDIIPIIRLTYFGTGETKNLMFEISFLYWTTYTVWEIFK